MKAKHKGVGFVRQLAVWILILIFTTQPVLAATEVVVDPSNGKNPGVMQAPNGTTVVQILAPNANGLSHNQYLNLQVGPNGIIYNNGVGLVNTKLAGWITGNTNLRGGSAQIILNEVTGKLPTNLNGFQEVAGNRATLILANPNGIVGNGFGFINVNRAVLTTGTPFFGGSGSLEAFRVTGGQIAIEGSGLDASTTDRVDIIARSVKLNAQLNANELNIITGANQVNATNNQATAISANPSEAKPAVALDVAALGGMYAGKITLVGTETGVGVNSQGTIQASGDIRLDQVGNISVTSNITTGGNLQVNTQSDIVNQGKIYTNINSIINSKGNVTNSGILISKQNNSIVAQSVTSSGIIGAGVNEAGSVERTGEISINTADFAFLKGKNIAGGDLKINSSVIDISNSESYVGSNLQMTATSGDIDQHGVSIQMAGRLDSQAKGKINNDASEIKAAQINLAARDISNRGGKLIQFGKNETNISAVKMLDNSNGVLSTNADTLNIRAESVGNGQGKIIQAGNGLFSLKSTDSIKNNSGEVQTNGALTITGNNIDNTKGTVTAIKGIEVIGDSLTNEHGSIVSGATIGINMQNNTNNQGGIIEAEDALNIKANNIFNQEGNINSLSTSGVKISALQSIDTKKGNISGNGDVFLTAGSLIDNNGGKIAAKENIVIEGTPTLLTNSAKGAISAGKNLSIQAASLNNGNGSVSAGQDITATTNEMIGVGSVIAGQDISISNKGTLTYSGADNIKSNRNIKLTTERLANQNNLSAVGHLGVYANSVDSTADGKLRGGTGVTITTEGDVVNRGELQSDSVNIKAKNIINTGTILGNNLTVTADTISNSGGVAVLATTKNMNLYAYKSLENKDSATIYSMGDIIVAGRDNKDENGNYINRTGTILNQSATIQAENDIQIYADDITNRKREFVTGQTVTNSINYGSPGQLIGKTWRNEYPNISAPMNALYGSVEVGYGTYLKGQVTTETNVIKDSAEGKLLAGKNMNLSAKTINNSMSSIMAAGKIDTAKDSVINNISIGRTRNITKLFHEYVDAFVMVPYTWREEDPVSHLYEWKSGASNAWFYSDRDLPSSTTSETITPYTSRFGGGQSVNIQARELNNKIVTPENVVINKVDNSSALGKSVESVAVQQTISSNVITVPVNGLVKIHQEPTAQYLVETNPRFANLQNFISSSDLLTKLGLDPAKATKRIGDGFYEQQLVREQVSELTGRYVLKNYDSAEEQFKALLDNGTTYAKAFHLQVGISLTKEQMEQLTSDIVWLVEKEVMGQKVLVPTVYLAHIRTHDLKAEGSIIAADDIRIKTTGDSINSGIIKANGNLKIEADNIINRNGLITGGQIGLTAEKDVLIEGGNLSAKDDISLKAGRKLEMGSLENTQRIAIPFTVTQKTTNVVSTVQAGGNVSIEAGQDAVLRGAQITAGDTVRLTANRNVDVNVVKDNIKEYTKTDLHYNDSKTTNVYDESVRGSSITAGNNINIAAKGGDVTVTGSELKTNKTSEPFKNVISSNVAASKENEYIIIPEGDSINKTTGEVTHHPAIRIPRNPEANSASATVNNSGIITISAAKNVTIQDAKETHDSLVETRTESSGFLSSTVTETRDQSHRTLSNGSTVSGDSVNINAGKDLQLKGSNVAATNDLGLTAGGNVELQSVKEKGQDEHYRFTKTSGLFSGGGLGFTIGQKSEKTNLQEKTIDEIGSTVGSINGNVKVTAGENVNSRGTTFVSGKDLTISGKAVTIENGLNTYDSQSKYEFKQTGLSVSLGGGIVDTAFSAIGNLQQTGEVKDERLKAIYAYKAAKDINSVAKGMKGDWKSGIGVNVSFGSSQMTSEQTLHSETANLSNISAGQNITITATENDLNIKGTKMDAVDITLAAKKDINIQSAQNKQQTDSKTSSSSWSVGGTIGVGFSGNFSSGKGSENGTVINNVASQVNASGTATLTSGNDTNILGSKVKGDKVVANVGGNLNIASQQDIDNYNAKNDSIGLGFTTGQKDAHAPAAGTAGPTGKSSIGGVTGSFNSSKTNSDYASVTNQAGIYAGKQGFDVTVKKNTDLKGAVIDSSATPNKNKLTTGTLTWSDLHNKAQYSAGSNGIALNTTPGAKLNQQGLTPVIGMTVNGNADSTTHSGVANGTIITTGNQKQDISSLNRNTQQAINTLGKIFDKQTVQEQQQLANLFGQLAFEEVHKLAQSQKNAAQKDLDNAKKNPKATQAEIDALQAKVDAWSEGGANKIALHALVGGIMSNIGGNGFASGAVGAGVNEAIQGVLSKIKDPALHQWGSALVGMAAASAVGGNASVGAATAASGTKNNLLNDCEIIRMKERLATALSYNDLNAVVAILQEYKETTQNSKDNIVGLAGNNYLNETYEFNDQKDAKDFLNQYLGFDWVQAFNNIKSYNPNATDQDVWQNMIDHVKQNAEKINYQSEQNRGNLAYLGGNREIVYGTNGQPYVNLNGTPYWTTMVDSVTPEEAHNLNIIAETHHAVETGTQPDPTKRSGNYYQQGGQYYKVGEDGTPQTVATSDMVGKRVWAVAEDGTAGWWTIGYDGKPNWAGTTGETYTSNGKIWEIGVDGQDYAVGDAPSTTADNSHNIVPPAVTQNILSFARGTIVAIDNNLSFGIGQKISFAITQKDANGNDTTAYYIGKVTGDGLCILWSGIELAAGTAEVGGGVILSGATAGVSLVVSNAGVATLGAGAIHATNTAVNTSNDLGELRHNAETNGGGTPNSESGRKYNPSPKHDPNSGWGSPDPYFNDPVKGQKALDTAYTSSKNKQLYNIEDGKIVKFQPDTDGSWHGYEVKNPSKEVPADVLRQMRDDGKITKAEYNKMINNN